MRHSDKRDRLRQKKKPLAASVCFGLPPDGERRRLIQIPEPGRDQTSTRFISSARPPHLLGKQTINHIIGLFQPGCPDLSLKLLLSPAAKSIIFQ